MRICSDPAGLRLQRTQPVAHPRRGTASPAAEVQRLERAVAARERELAILAEVAARVHGQEDVQAILDQTLDSLLEGLELRTAWVFLEDAKNGPLHLAAHRGVGADRHVAAHHRQVAARLAGDLGGAEHHHRVAAHLAAHVERAEQRDRVARRLVFGDRQASDKDPWLYQS